VRKPFSVWKESLFLRVTEGFGGDTLQNCCGSILMARREYSDRIDQITREGPEIREGAMAMKRKNLGILVGIMVWAVLLGFSGNTAAYPEKTITILVSAAPGGSTDLTARMLAKRMTEILKTPVVVDNKVGAGGFMMGSALNSSASDGYTVGVFPSSHFILAHFIRKPPFDIFKFTPIMSYGIYPFTLAVKADAPWKTLKDFLDYAKAHPGQVSLSTSNPDSMENLPIWMLEEKLGLKLKLVPYHGGAPAVAAVLGGHAQAFTGVGEAIPNIRDGSMRGLATYLGERMPGLPDLPTLKELGYDIVVESRLAVYGPAGVPQAIAKTLEDAFQKAMDNPDFKKICDSFEVVPSWMSASQVDRYHRDLAAKTKPILIRLGKIKE
jgi:tripartite-type tricarboxylate transporter receptor subunit TctC